MKEIFLFIILSISFFHSYAQTPQIETTPKDSLKVVEILSSDRYSYQKKDSLTEVLLLVGKVVLKQENTLFYADSAIYNKNTKIVEAFGHVHINDNDSIDTYSDYLLYHVDTKQATLTDNVRLTDGKSNLYTNQLEYDINEKTGIYINGGRVVNGSSVLTSQVGTYYADLKDVYFRGDVKLKDPKYDLSSDSLLYNTNTEIATFIAKTLIIDSAKRTILTKEGYYDLKNKHAVFGKRPVIHDGASTIIADDIRTDDVTGNSVLTGNAVYRDTAQGFSMLANSIVANRSQGSLLATLKPLMILKQDKDSLFITADTLEAGKLSQLVIEQRTKDSIKAVQQAIIADSINAAKLAAGSKKNSSARKTAATRPDSANAAKNIVNLADSSLSFSDTLNLSKINQRDKPADSSGTLSVSTDSARTRLSANEVSDSVTQTKPLMAITGDSLAAIGKRNSRINNKISKAKPGKAGQPLSKKALTNQNDSLSGKITNRDTAISASNNQNDSADRFFRAYSHVRIFSDSLQAVSDSLFYSGKDSIFRLFQDPVIWASDSQVTGDTIYLYTKNKKADQLYVFENGLIINKTGTGMFNQIRGNRLNGYFKNGEMDYMRARGNGESIYYVKDNQEKLIGVNKATADIIDIRFLAKELNRVVFISDVKGTMYPITKITDDDRKLRNFKWLDERRPKSKFELFGN